MFCAVNRALRRQRRRLAVLAVLLGLAGAVVVAHSAMGHGHMGDHSAGGALVICLAVADTAVVAFGAAVAFGLWMRRMTWLIPAVPAPPLSYVPAPRSAPARAGPTRLQVFRL